MAACSCRAVAAGAAAAGGGLAAARLVVDAELEGYLGQVVFREGSRRHKRREHRRALKGLCDGPRKTIALELGLLASTREVKAKTDGAQASELRPHAELAASDVFTDEEDELRLVVDLLRG